jgi:hypothetical protein
LQRWRVLLSPEAAFADYGKCGAPVVYRISRSLHSLFANKMKFAAGIS